MNLAPLQLTDYYITHLSLDSNPEFNSKKPADDPVETLTIVPEYSLADHKGEHGTEWLVSLDISQSIPEGANLPYAFKLHLYGYVLASPYLEGARLNRAIHANGPAMLLGAAREIVRAATGRGPWPAIIIPSTNFLSNLPPLEAPTNGAQATRKVKVKPKAVTKKKVASKKAKPSTKKAAKKATKKAAKRKK